MLNKFFMLFFSENKYYVHVEKEIVQSNGCTTFVEAFKIFFSFFFIMNMEYPKKIATTLEMIQRYIFKIHPDSGTKSKRVPTAKKQEIALMVKLKEHLPNDNSRD